MKTIIITICALALTTYAILQSNIVKQRQIQQSPKKADAMIKFPEQKHNFGKIKIGVPVTYDFVFKNIGNKPIVIEYAKASCGCTKPGWPETPVAKTKEGEISAGFNAAVAGAFSKTIFVKVTGYDELLELQITGKVLSADEYTKYKATQQHAKKAIAII